MLNWFNFTQTDLNPLNRPLEPIPSSSSAWGTGGTTTTTTTQGPAPAGRQQPYPRQAGKEIEKATGIPAGTIINGEHQGNFIGSNDLFERLSDKRGPRDRARPGMKEETVKSSVPLGLSRAAQNPRVSTEDRISL